MAKVTKRAWTTARGETRQAWRVDFTDSEGRRQRKQYQTKREADAFRVEIEGQLRSGTFRHEADKTTVKEICTAYLEYATGRFERGERFTHAHLHAVTGHVWNYICPDQVWRESKQKSAVKPFTQGIGEIKLSQLSPKKIGAFRDRLRAAGLSVVLTRKVLTNLHAILAYAIGQDLVATNAAHSVKVIGRRDEGAKKVYIPPKETMKALLSVADPDFRLKLIFAASTAVRAGELHALRWHHLNFDLGEVKIETRVDAWHDEDVTKTAAGMRTVPLGNPVVTMLKKWKLRTKFKKTDDLVFPNKRGGYVGHPNMVKRRFKPLFDLLDELHARNPRKYPKVERFTWHTLRHYGISLWIEADLRPKTVQTFAGHSSLAVTMDRYGHLFKSDDHKKAMDSIAKDLANG
jgi:integrase